jgi:hypothetical protein
MGKLILFSFVCQPFFAANDSGQNAIFAPIAMKILMGQPQGQDGKDEVEQFDASSNHTIPPVKEFPVHEET